jgi:hypothetical protein
MTLPYHHPVDLLAANMTDSKPTTTYTNAEVHSSNVRFMRSSSSSLKILNSLPTDQLVVLFTPAIPSADGHEDPFECLGRSLSKRHARVCRRCQLRSSPTDRHENEQQHAGSNEIRSPSGRYTAQCPRRLADPAVQCLH